MTAFTEPLLSGLKNGDNIPTLQSSVDHLENVCDTPSRISERDSSLVNRSYKC